MNFRTSYLVGLMASALLIFTVSPLEQSAFAAEPLKITGPDGEVRQTARQYGPTQSSDTFWSIAQKVRPDSSVSIYQVMAAIYDANPHAFSNANFNSLEKGMILLIPSKELMSAIPKSMAKARAESNDKDWQRATQPAKATVAPTPTETVAETKAPVRPVTLPIIAPDTEAPSTESVDGVAELTAKLEEAEAKNLELTDELGRAQDQLDLGSNDTDTLKGKIEELNEQVAILEEQLQISKQQGAGLTEEVKSLQEQIAALQTPEPEAPSDQWRSFMDNPLLLVGAISIPAIVLLVLLWLFLRRRKDEGKISEEQAEQGEAETPPTAAVEDSSPDLDAVSEQAAEDDAGAMAVHLDTEEDDSIDSLMSVDSSELAPEVDMSLDSDQVDLASEMFVDPGETAAEEEPAEEEGQSLDDLWAEAMGEQDEEESKPNEEDDLDSLLAGFDEPEAPAVTADESIEEDAEESVELSTPTEDVSKLVSEDDLDSLLAGFDEPAAENSQPEEVAETPAEDDLDSLLAGFDEPAEEPAAEPEAESVAESVAEDATEIAETPAEDDLDSLLAGFDESAEEPVAESAASVAEDETDIAETSAEDDIDSLLAGFDEPAVPTEEAVETGDEPAAEDDLDALLGDLASNEEPENATDDLDITNDSDITDAISAELESEITVANDEEDLDALLAGFDEPSTELSTEPSNDDTDLSDAISAELEGEVKTQDDSEEDLDALLAGFDEPSTAADDAATDNAEALATEQPDLSDAISAELEGEVTDSETSEDDLDSLLAEFDIADSGIAETLDMPADDIPEDISAPLVDDTGKKDEALDSLLADLEAVDPATAKDPVAVKGTGGMFADLKGGKKSDDNSLDWESANSEQAPVITPSSNDELLNQESSSAIDDIDAGSLSLSSDDDSKLTVDEALAALDAEELDKSPAVAVPEHDLTTFQKDNGFIDIDRLLNDADEDELETDQYKELDVDMGELDNLMGNAAMVDVDDEENSVNAKLDLARAYIEIDDNDSAKALLKEVKLDGNTRQQEEADGLLQTLD
ncbi:FimV/HubP family polar landmark protein [Shewanella sp. UCD-KL12]|uniref:FimV/HubP family polar landmark protein n=1 Tax=Shewanella sp. UCD-KL12 TaxID=1917163 RepID=UPI0009711B18|nr:FimV/HubP family polar landmark protein [Shewanella sp. UCD-KL12]